MERKIKVEAVWKERPEIRLYVLALIALARQLQEEEQRAAERSALNNNRGEVEHD